jgi:hypothetical protein
MKCFLVLVPFAIVSIPASAAAQETPMAPSPVAVPCPVCPPPPAAEPASEPVSSPGMILGGLGVVTLGLGGIAGGIGLAFAGQMRAGSENLTGSGGQPNDAVTAGGVAVAVGGVATVAIGIWMITRGATPASRLNDASRSPKRDALAPFVSPHPGGAGLGVRF